MKYKELYAADNTLLDGTSFPDGIDADVARAAISGRVWECDVIYEDAATFKMFVENWSATRQVAFLHLLAVADAEYSPIENYNRIESETRTPDITRTRTPDLTQSDSGTVISENTISADNADSYQPDNKSTTIPNTSTHTTGTETNTETGTETIARNTHGNIGVTTNQDMINAEIDTLPRLNIYNWIASDFEDYLCITKY